MLVAGKDLRVEARSLILESSMAEIIATAGPGKVPIRMWEQANATDRLAGDLGRKLGLDSAGRAQLRQSEASTQSSLADLAATGRAIRERRAAELAEKDEARSAYQAAIVAAKKLDPQRQAQYLEYIEASMKKL